MAARSQTRTVETALSSKNLALKEFLDEDDGVGGSAKGEGKGLIFREQGRGQALASRFQARIWTGLFAVVVMTANGADDLRWFVSSSFNLGTFDSSQAQKSHGCFTATRNRTNPSVDPGCPNQCSSRSMQDSSLVGPVHHCVTRRRAPELSLHSTFLVILEGKCQLAGL